MSTQTTEQTAATLTIRDADKMTEEGRMDVASWLNHQAESLVENGNGYASRFRARYLYSREEE